MTLTDVNRVAVMVAREMAQELKGGRVKKAGGVKSKVDARITREEALAKLLHESGRKAVERGNVLRLSVPPVPFVEWDNLPAPAMEGRRMMARFLLDLRRRASVKALFAGR